MVVVKLAQLLTMKLIYIMGACIYDADDNGNFDGYVLFMQSQGSWGITSYARIIDIINYMITNNKLDPFQNKCKWSFFRWPGIMGYGY